MYYEPPGSLKWYHYFTVFVFIIIFVILNFNNLKINFSSIELTDIKEILVSLAAIVTAYVAARGLFIWRDQLKGTDKYRLSKDILMKTYNLQEAIMSVRNPWISNTEASQRELDQKINETETEQEKNIRNEAYALWKRTEPMFKTVSELRVSKFEAMALLGRSFVSDINSIIIKTFELRNAQSIYFRMKIDRNLTDHKLIDKYWRIVYEMPEKEDTFRKEIEEIVSKIEDKFHIIV